MTHKRRGNWLVSSARRLWELAATRQLHAIVAVLSLLAVLLAVFGGYLYYGSLSDASARRSQQEGELRLSQLAEQVSYALLEKTEVVRAMAGLAAFGEALRRPTDPTALAAANELLARFARALEVNVCYLMTTQGDTIASSNYLAPDSFVGANFAFRPYFSQGFANPPATYLALGVTSNKRGVYHSYPVYDGDDAIGLVVLKKNVDLIEQKLPLNHQERLLVTDPHGVVFISNLAAWRFGSLRPLDAPTRASLSASRQLGRGPWPWIGLETSEPGQFTDRAGNHHTVFETELTQQPGWRVYFLRRGRSMLQRVLAPLLAPAGSVILLLCLTVGVSVTLLYRKATREIRRRREVQKALRESETRHRSLYHRTPAMLHSVDPNGVLVSASDYWLEALGHQRDQVIGKPLTDFLTAASRQHNQQVVFPAFVASGVVHEAPHQLVKKNGEVIDVLLSAITERDADGAPRRSLAVSVDVTERKKAEQALRAAKEELSRYSRELERIVRERTQQNTDILTHTPAVVYIKDLSGKYTYINPQFEKLFAITNPEAKQKTAHDIFPRACADGLAANDRQVVSQRHALQVEEELPHPDGVHTYLSVKFPLFDAERAVTGVCAISTDITEVKRAEIQLRRLSDSILDNQEKERAALARELHDELGQNLTALRLESVWLKERLHTNDQLARDRASEMCELIDKTIEDVRGLAFRLRPEILDDLGLVDALDLCAIDFERRTGILCVFESHGALAPMDSVATVAYRIAQEALTNVARHAGASHVEVSLKAVADGLRLEVHDDGCGFSQDAGDDFAGLGLAGMRERASLVGGKLVVESERGSGTRVFFEVTSPSRAAGLRT